MAEIILGGLVILAVVVGFLALAANGFSKLDAPVISQPPTKAQIIAAWAEKQPHARARLTVTHEGQNHPELNGCGWDGQ
jgi:hypothetical protein